MAVMMMSRDDLTQALNCRMSTHFGIDCNHCPYGRKFKERYVCDVAKICHDTLAVIKADASEINRLAKLSNEYKAMLMNLGVKIK